MINRENISKYRELCQFLERQKHHFAPLNLLEHYFPNLCKIDSPERKELFVSYKIQLIQWKLIERTSWGKLTKFIGWELCKNWQEQLDRLEAQLPRNYDVVLGGQLHSSGPRPYDVVLGGLGRSDRIINKS